MRCRPRQLATLLAVGMVAALLCAGTVGAKGIETQRKPGLDHLADSLSGSAALAANIAEAAHANGLDLRQWPSADAPVSRVVAEPPPDASNISLLRPLRALALAGDARAAPDGELTRRVLERSGPAGYGDPRTFNDDAYAILALHAARLPMEDPRVQATRDHLLHAQRADGGWGWTLAAPSGTDVTGLVVEALVASGGIPETTAAHARAFLQTTRAQVGFAEMPGGTPNCESTVWGLRATDRLGEAPRDADWWFLLGLQRPDGGFAHLPEGPSDLLCTSEAVSLLGEVHQGGIPGPAMGDRGAPGPSVAFAVLSLVLATALWVRRP